MPLSGPLAATSENGCGARTPKRRQARSPTRGHELRADVPPQCARFLRIAPVAALAGRERGRRGAVGKWHSMFGGVGQMSSPAPNRRVGNQTMRVRPDNRSLVLSTPVRWQSAGRSSLAELKGCTER